MNINIGPRGTLEIDNARIIFRNLEGRGGLYNREGDRNFAVLIEDEAIAEQLTNDGWNVKIKLPRDEDDSPFMYLPVKVKFNERGPSAYLKIGRNMTRLDEESIACLDKINILSVDLDIRPFDWEVNGKVGRTAYLQAIRVTQDVDRFAENIED